MKVNHCLALCASLVKLRDSAHLTDVRLKVGSQSLNAHKVVLASQSSFFRSKLLTASKRLSVIDLNDYGVSSYVNVKALVEYLYTGEFQSSVDSQLNADALALGINLTPHHIKEENIESDFSVTDSAHEEPPDFEPSATKRKKKELDDFICKPRKNATKCRLSTLSIEGASTTEGNQLTNTVGDVVDSDRKNDLDPPSFERKKPGRPPKGTIHHCDKCDFTTKYMVMLRKHSEQHKTKKPVECHVCGLVFKYTSSLLRHHKRCHVMDTARFDAPTLELWNNTSCLKQPDGIYQCPDCDYSTSVCVTMYRHRLMKHTKLRPYSCPYCDASFKCTNHLNRHLHTKCRMHSSTGEQSYKADNNSLFLVDKAVKQTLDRVGGKTVEDCFDENQAKYVCPLCRENDPEFLPFIFHLREHSQPGVFSCSNCNLSFRNKTELTKHLPSCDEQPLLIDNLDTRIKPDDDLLKDVVLSLSLGDIESYKERSNQYVCPKCQLHSIGLPEFKSHLLQHYNQEIYTCKQCQKSFKDEDCLQNHKETTHSLPAVGDEPVVAHTVESDSPFLKDSMEKLNISSLASCRNSENRYVCPRCDHTTASAQDFKTHIVLHFHPGIFTCHLCEKTFKQKRNLTKHLEMCQLKTPDERRKQDTVLSNDMLSEALKKLDVMDLKACVNAQNRYACPKCSHTTASLQDIKHHLMLHLHPDIYTCPLCKKTFRQKRNVAKHLLVCPLRAEDHEVREFRKDKKSRAVLCDLCGKKLANHHNLASHYKAVHKKQRDFQCTRCPYTSFSTNTLEVHYAYTHGVCLDGTPRKKNICCKQCEFKCYFIHQLKVHMMRHERILPHKCKSCDYATNLKDSLRKHMLSHAKSMSFHCGECGKRFNSQSGHRVHMMKHKGLKPYKCDICDDSFLHQKSLLQHRFRHEKVKPFACDICSYDCWKGSSLSKHYKSRHNIKREFVEPRLTEFANGKSVKSRVQVLIPRSAMKAAATNITPILDQVEAETSVNVIPSKPEAPITVKTEPAFVLPSDTLDPTMAYHGGDVVIKQAEPVDSSDVAGSTVIEIPSSVPGGHVSYITLPASLGLGEDGQSTVWELDIPTPHL